MASATAVRSQRKFKINEAHAIEPSSNNKVSGASRQQTPFSSLIETVMGSSRKMKCRHNFVSDLANSTQMETVAAINAKLKMELSETNEAAQNKLARVRDNKAKLNKGRAEIPAAKLTVVARDRLVGKTMLDEDYAAPVQLAMLRDEAEAEDSMPEEVVLLAN